MGDLNAFAKADYAYRHWQVLVRPARESLFQGSLIACYQ